jgi:hypothetical protein
MLMQLLKYLKTKTYTYREHIPSDKMTFLRTEFFLFGAGRGGVGVQNSRNVLSGNIN